MADIMDNIVFATSQQVIGDTLLVTYSNGKIKTFNVIKLGCEWFNMSNDGFYSTYGFNFNPHEWGLYDRCRKLVYGNG